ncbi:MAG TPA: trigger factor [Candidatus Saccharibacteria bacterium]|nr:trigger factor [Candidatus Saccharibacteria bacterium]
MEISLKNNSTTNLTLSLSLDPDEIKAIEAKAIKALGKNLKVQGFRKGHVPESVAKKNIGEDNLAQEVLNQAITDAYSQAIKEKKIEVLDQPKIEVESFDLKTGLKFKASVDVMPEIKLHDYTKIKKSIKPEPVTDEEIKDVIDNLLQRSASYKSVERKSENGDRIWIDFEGFDAKGKPFKGGKGDNYPLSLGSNTFIPGFEEGLLGSKAGDETELSLTFPKSYHEKSLAGKKVKFKVKVNKVEETVKPELNEEFFKQFSPDIKTIDDFKKDIASQMQIEKDIKLKKNLQDEIVEEIIAKTEFDLPEILVKDQQEMIIYDSEQNLKYRGVTLEESLEQEDTTKDEWIKNHVIPEAEKRVRIGIIISEVAKKEQIKVSDSDVNSRLSLMRQQYIGNQEALAQLDDPRMKRELISRIATEKAIDRLVSLATEK